MLAHSTCRACAVLFGQGRVFRSDEMRCQCMVIALDCDQVQGELVVACSWVVAFVLCGAADGGSHRLEPPVLDANQMTAHKRRERVPEGVSIRIGQTLEVFCRERMLREADPLEELSLRIVDGWQDNVCGQCAECRVPCGSVAHPLLMTTKRPAGCDEREEHLGRLFGHPSRGVMQAPSDVVVRGHRSQHRFHPRVQSLRCPRTQYDRVVAPCRGWLVCCDEHCGVPSIDQRVEYAARSIGEHLEVIDQHMQRVRRALFDRGRERFCSFLWVIACGQRRYRVG